MKSILTNTPFQTVIALLSAALLYDVMPGPIASGFYTFSVFIKDAIMIILPAAVFFFIASSLVQFEKKGIFLVLLILVFEAFSNALASTSAYGLSFIGESFLSKSMNLSQKEGLTSYLSFAAYKPTWWRVEFGTVLGVFLGLITPYIQKDLLKRFIFQGKSIASAIFSRIFARIIPLFVFGFFLNMFITGSFVTAARDCLEILIIMMIGLFFYITLIFMVAGGNFKRGIQMIKNALPAGFTAFSSMSSAATMPVTIAVTEKNLMHKPFAGMLIPATTNIQQIGDCFCNVFLCCMILSFFGRGLPDPLTFFTFLSVFVIARYTTAGMIGGAIFIMLPIYQSYLGFNAEMISLILGFNMVLDPLITATNVMANSGLCVIFEKLWSLVNKKAAFTT